MFLQISFESLMHQGLPFGRHTVATPWGTLFGAACLAAALLLTLAWMTAALTIRHSGNDGSVKKVARGRNRR